MNYTIALAQLALKRGDLDGNYALVEEAVQQAGRDGADLVLLPELWASGFDLARASEYASKLNQDWFERMSTLAVKNKVGLGGTLIEKRGAEFFNTFVLYDQEGLLLGLYRKIHLFQKLEEDRYLQSGAEIKCLKTPWGKLGLAICYDLRFPEIFREYAVSGAEIILISAEWPAKRIEHWNVLLKARAIENQVFIAAVNKSGMSQGAPLGGNSCVVDPMGGVLVRGNDQPGLLMAEIDTGQVEQTRKWMPVFQDRKPDVY